jgi:hypothetical protein
MLTINVTKTTEGFRADLQAPSDINGVADLRLRGIGARAVDAIEQCLEQLTDLSGQKGQRADIAKRFF